MIEVRAADDSELEAIARLQTERNGADCDAMVRAQWNDPSCGPSRFTVAADDGTVVSSVCLISGQLQLEGAVIPYGEPEFVATATSHGHQGLVRRQFELLHQWSADDGHLTQLIGGIPYFYRRFGYEYAIPVPRLRLVLPGTEFRMPAGWSVRPATDDDVDAIVDLERPVQRQSDLTAARRAESWRWWIAYGGAEVGPGIVPHVALRDNEIAASASMGNGPPGVAEGSTTVSWVAGHHPDGLEALMAHAAQTCPGKAVAVLERAGLASTIEARSTRHPRHYAFYVRVPDPVALLDHLRPVLDQRLAASTFATTSGELLLSTYTRTITLSYEDGVITDVEGGGPEQDPLRRGGAGVPPDLVATLIYGRYGASGLAARHDDVRLGRTQPLMDVLFPQLTSDVLLEF